MRSIGSPTKPVTYRRSGPTPISTPAKRRSMIASRQAESRAAYRSAGIWRADSLMCGE